MHWWEASKEEVHEAVVVAFKKIDKDQALRRAKYAAFLGLYEGRDVSSLDGAAWAKGQADTLEDEDSKENVLKSAVDAMVAKISTNRPRLIQVTNGADIKLQKKAEKRTLMIEGVIHEQKGYKKGRKIFKDACIWDCGLMKVYPDFKRKKVIYERVLVDEIGVDSIDGKYGNPRSIVQAKTISRSEVFACFPEKENQYAITQANRLRAHSSYSEAIDDPVTILEAWHLPSGPDQKDGRHVICVDTGSLDDDEWTRERFPFAVFRFKERPLGWHGMGMIEDALNPQKQQTFYDRRIGHMLTNASIRVAIEKNSDVNIADLTNDDYSFPTYEYVGTKPEWNHDPGPPPELFIERREKKSAVFEQLGLSQLTAQSKKPKGLSSGEALREYKDTESERFADVGQDWDDVWVEIGELTLDALEELSEHPETKNIELSVPTGGDLKSIKLSDVDMDRSKYQLQIRPAALLPKEPAGRIATIQEMMGLFPQAAPFLAAKINNPDVNDAMSMLTAGVDTIRFDIERLSDGEFITPEPFLDLELAKPLALAAYHKARNGNADQKALEAFRNYLLSLQNMLDERAAMMMAAQGGGMPPGGPQAAPMPPEALAAVEGMA